LKSHLLHLTNWRDFEFRTLHSTGNGATYRPDWNSEASKIPELIIEKALRNVSEQGTTGWPLAFKPLFEASCQRYRNKFFAWPTDLAEKADVEQFLTRLGL